MMYQLIMAYDDGSMKKERATLPNIMSALSVYMEDGSWTFTKIMNCQTGEVIATWTNTENGITV